MPHTYALHPLIWSDAEQAHTPPPGAGTVLDLRPEDEQARAGQSSGWGFFSWPDQIYDESGALAPNPHAVSLDAIQLGYGDCREYKPTTAERNELKTRLGITGELSGETLVAAIRSVLGENADPTGQSGPKPIMPTREGVLEIHFAYHSRVWAESFDWRELFATTPKGRANRMRDVVRRDLETAHASGGNQLLAKVLGGWCDRAGIEYSNAAAWRGLMRASLRQKAGGEFRPKRPRTSYSDDFNRADSSTLGSPWNYYHTAGVGPYESTLGISSNLAAHYKPSTDGSGLDLAAYMSAVSSSDHWVELTLHSTTSVNKTSVTAHVLVRQNSTPDRNNYWARNTFVSGSSSSIQLGKYVSGTSTTLGTLSGATKTLPWVLKLDVSGSTLTGFYSGTSSGSTTDTSHTGNLYGGMGTYISPRPSTTYYAAWAIDDGVSAGGQPMALRTAGQRRGWSRVGRAW